MKIGITIHRVKSCPSTNDLAKEMAESGAQEGTIVIAQEQTKGRGTKSRSWFSAKGKGLYLSLILRPPKKVLSLLPLVAGLATREAIQKSSGLDTQLLWPNDIVWEKQKLGGILCESEILGNQLMYTIIGLGLNLSHERRDFPPEIRRTATSLKLATKKFTDEDVLLEYFCETFSRWYRFLCQGKGGEIIKAFERYSSFRRGDKINLIRDEGQISGNFLGLAADGALLLEVGMKKHIFYSAEIKKIEHEERREKCF